MTVGIYLMVDNESIVGLLLSLCSWGCRKLPGRDLRLPVACRWAGAVKLGEVAVLALVVDDDARALSRILAGGIAIVLEFVSIVRPETTVALVDCKECESEKVDDLTEDEHNENNGVILTLSTVSMSSRSRSASRIFTRFGVSSHKTLVFKFSSSLPLEGHTIVSLEDILLTPLSSLVGFVFKAGFSVLASFVGWINLLTQPDNFRVRPKVI